MRRKDSRLRRCCGWRGAVRLDRVAEELRPESETKGNADLIHLNETDALLELIQKGRHARYLYHAGGR
jgi:hypothetical protein